MLIAIGNERNPVNPKTNKGEKRNPVWINSLERSNPRSTGNSWQRNSTDRNRSLRK